MILGGLWLHVLVVAAIMRPLSVKDVLRVQDDMLVEVDVQEVCEDEIVEKTLHSDHHSKDFSNNVECFEDASAHKKCIPSTGGLVQTQKGSQDKVSSPNQGNTPQENPMVNQEQIHNDPKLKVTNVIKDYCDFLGSPKLPCLMLTAILSSFSYYSLYFVFPPLAEEIGMSKMAASRLIVLANATELVSRIFVGSIADRLKSQKHWILFFSFGVSPVLGMCVSFLTSPTVLTAYAVLFGLFGGTFAPMLIPLTVELVPSERIGSATGLFPFLTGTGQSLGPPILGMYNIILQSYY